MTVVRDCDRELFSTEIYMISGINDLFLQSALALFWCMFRERRCARDWHGFQAFALVTMRAA